MPPKKRAKHSTVNTKDGDTAPCRQSSRNNRGVGSHAAQLQKAGEAIAAPARSCRKNDYLDLDASDPEENSMAPSQMRGGKKIAPAKPRAVGNGARRKPASATPPTTSNDLELSSQELGNNVRNRPLYTSPHPVLRTACSSDRFGFKAPISTTTQCIKKVPQSTSRRMAAQEEDERDDNDNEDKDDNDDNTGLHEHNDTQETYDVLECHQAQNGRCKAPSPSYLSKATGKARARASTRSMSPRQRPSQHYNNSRSPHSHLSQHHDNSRSPHSRLSQHHDRLGSRQRVPSVGASSVRVPPSSHNSSTGSRSQRQSSYRHIISTQASLHTQHRRSPNTSSRGRTQPSSHRHSPSRTRSDHAMTPSRSRSRSATPTDARRTQNIKTNQDNPSKLGFYPPSVLSHPIPEHQDALKLAQEVLDAELWASHQKKLKFVHGYFPEYNPQMCRLLCDDLFTFHTELKKTAISITKQSYDIFPKGAVMRSEEIKKRVVATASRLIKTGDYLRIPDSSNGKFKNFVSQALKDICIEFFYSNSKKALKNTDDFHRTLPVNGLILAVVVVKGVFLGSAKQALTRTDFVRLQKSVNKLLDIPERREELEEMLAQWAKIGMGGSDWHLDGSDAGSDAGTSISYFNALFNA
ncbi:uncharacterized protein F5891DRAFT_1201527 [Suillus fuscotomentosus]|uniref:DUF6532 domain-containing protein n=1 Tax=Suillus fuscotomentosus TaxID=1912939 RepID=A0AAD4DN86_9AGAM|nr:uncharacterized protein F5891DRAFT_1201527 [Suillus fuscotomentosus]KAG1885861.1 hypothetical protein F5891DRAFT_1201527 [Suillus fuscotomentosus]